MALQVYFASVCEMKIERVKTTCSFFLEKICRRLAQKQYLPSLLFSVDVCVPIVLSLVHKKRSLVTADSFLIVVEEFYDDDSD